MHRFFADDAEHLAVATDNGGVSTTSPAISVTISADNPPTVAITSPNQGATFGTGAVVKVTANGMGEVVRIEFDAEALKDNDDPQTTECADAALAQN